MYHSTAPDRARNVLFIPSRIRSGTVPAFWTGPCTAARATFPSLPWPCSPARSRSRAATRAGGATASDAPAGAGAHGTPDGHPDGIRGLAGGSYFGVVKVRVVPPDGSGIRATTRNGRASASLEPSGRLVVSGDVDRESDAGFAAEGRFSSGGWPEFDSSKAHFRPTPSNGAGFRATGRQKPRYTGC